MYLITRPSPPESIVAPTAFHASYALMSAAVFVWPAREENGKEPKSDNPSPRYAINAISLMEWIVGSSKSKSLSKSGIDVCIDTINFDNDFEKAISGSISFH
jgi:hypothetical protein